MSNDKTYQKLIHSQRWQRLRRWKLQAHPLCEMCEKQGRTTLATEVHHVTPVEFALNDDQKVQLMFNAGNLMVLCHDCHVRIHTEMGRSGRKRTQKQTQEQMKEFRRKYIPG